MVSLYQLHKVKVVSQSESGVCDLLYMKMSFPVIDLSSFRVGDLLMHIVSKTERLLTWFPSGKWLICFPILQVHSQHFIQK